MASCAQPGCTGTTEDGACKSCGHKVSPAQSTPSIRAAAPTIAPTVEVGSTLAGREVIAARDADLFVARGKDGVEFTACTGLPASLAVEAEALRALQGHTGFPTVIELGTDPRGGAYLLTTQMGANATPLAVACAKLPLKAALRALEQVIELAAHVEEAGYGWQPSSSDLVVTKTGAVVTTRLRNATRLAGDTKLDAGPLLERIGGALLPLPGAFAPTSLVRLLVPLGPALPKRQVTLEDAKGEIARALIEARAEEGEATAASEGAAIACDPGLRREHNEDAVTFATGGVNGEAWTVLVVCDGVSSSTHAEEASSIAAKTTCDALAHFARAGDITPDTARGALTAAIRAAHVAICAAKIEHGKTEPPGTTIVAALAYRRRVTIGWVGDSRAYWVTDSGAELLTRDHSWANEVVANEEMTEEEAMKNPLAHALTRCLGPLEVGDGLETVEPDLRACDLPGAGHLVLCSDGLWNYCPDAAQLGALVHSVPPASRTPLRLARYLVNYAISRGGQDNVSVAVYAQR